MKTFRNKNRAQETNTNRSWLSNAVLPLFVLLGLKSRAEAQTDVAPPDLTGFVDMNGIENLREVILKADGSAQLVFGDGASVLVSASEFQVVGGQVFVSQAALTAAGVSVASGGAALLTGATLLGGGAAAAAGAAGSGGGSESVSPPPPPPPVNNAPEITSDSTASVVENQSAAYTVTATDPEGTTPTYSISGGADASLFNIDSTTGAVTFVAAPDFEVPSDDDGNNVYEVEVTASDGTNSTAQLVSITVTNENDNSPAFTSGTNASVAENQTSAYTAAATDFDGTTPTYSISGGADAALFTIDSATGEVSFVVAPDFETPTDADGDNVYEVQVTATDGTNSTTQLVSIAVTDENDNAPTFTSGSVSNSAENQTAAYIASATDADGTTPTYSITGGDDAGLFTIDSTSGAVSFLIAPDFETPGDTDGNNVYEIQVTATDGTNSTAQLVSITVTDENDNAPVFTSLSSESVSENQTSAYTATATDPEGTTPTYSITGGDDAALFDIDTTTGAVTFKTAPDFEAPGDTGGDNVYEVQVTATDGTNSTAQLVSITVTNENDNSPSFTSGTTASVAENQTGAYTAVATDADGTTPTYSITGGDDAALFDINTTTGAVTFKTAPDFEAPGDTGADNVYEVQVTATDGTNSTAQLVSITVTNENDNAPVFTSGTSANAAENQTAAYTATATDADGTTPTYSITGGDDAALFDIDTTTGAVTFKTAPDFETPGDTGGDNVYEVQVTATDGTNSTAQLVSITVTDAFDPAAVIELNSLNSVQGFIVQGDMAEDRLGFSVSNAGDINGDGFSDVIVGSAGGDDGGTDSGEAYVVFGGAGGFGSDVSGRQVIDVTNLSSTEGFIIQGEDAEDLAGTSVSSAGDVNGDGIDDLIIGAHLADGGGPNSGESYVIFGGASGFGVDVSGRQVIDLANLDANQGFLIFGDTGGDSSGRVVSSAGDINGDGLDDLLVGAFGGDDGGSSAGEAYVVFGSDQGFGVDVSGQQVVDLTNLGLLEGFIIQGDSAFDSAGGFALASAGDINGDGYDDVILGARTGDDGGSSAGEAYVIFGSGAAFGAEVSGRQVIDLTSLSVSQGFVIQGDYAGDAAGTSVSSAGDINGDGFDDVIVGARLGDDGGSFAGEAYVVFGTDAGFGAAVSGRQVIDLTSLSANEGFIIQGDSAGEELGISVSSAGDLNGDGFADLIVGASEDHNTAGGAFIIYGAAGGFGIDVAGRQVIDTTNLSETQGTEIRGDAFFDDTGISVSLAGDINRDGFDDIIVGAHFGDDGGIDAGEAYVIFGGQFQVGDGTGQTIVGTSGAESLIGDVGDDSLTGNGGADVFRGGAGDDTITVADLTFADIDGGAGTDTLALSGSGQTLDLTATLPAEIHSIETIDLTGSGDNTLVLNQLSIFDLTEERSGGTATITVQGNAGDTVSLSSESGWALTGTTVIDTITYDVYENGNATVNIQQDVSVTDLAAPVIDLSSVSSAQGFIVQGDMDGDRAGHSVSIAGDINGDGFDDFILGAYYGDDGNNRAGEAYILFGGSGLFGNSDAGRQVIDLTNLAPSQGFIVQGDSQTDRVGDAVSGAGDVNGDGFDDLIVGAPFASGGARNGESYVVFGGDSTFGTEISGRQVLEVSSLSGSEGFVIVGTQRSVNGSSGDLSGFSVAGLGDINGDGFDDLIVGAPGGDDGGGRAGEGYVIFGTSDEFGTETSGRQVISLSLLDESEGFIVQGDTGTTSFNGPFIRFQIGDQAGLAVASLGDIDGDGYDDFVVGAPQGDDGGNSAGEAYVIFGSPNTFGIDISGQQVLDLTNISQIEGFIIQGDESGDVLGISVSGGGDINGDGFDDLLVGASSGDDGGTRAGEAYVVFGSANGFGVDVSGRQVLDLSALSPSEGFILQGEKENDRAGTSLANAGDVNGDGFDDILVGASNAAESEGILGSAYLVFGGPSTFGDDIAGRQVLELGSLSSGQGFTISGDADGDRAGISVSGGGDINGDGFDDLIIGADSGDDGGTDAGEAYVIFGGQFEVGDGTGQTIVGTSGAESLIGDVGDDSLTGNGGADVFRGGAGDDVITVADLTFADIDGGTGSDTLALSGSGQILDLTSTLPAEIQSIETIDLTGSGDNTLVLNQLSVFDLTEERSGGKATITVEGNAGDTVAFDDAGWTANGITVIDTVTYDVYENGNATVNVQQGVDVTGLPAPIIDTTTLSAAQGFIVQGDQAGDRLGYSSSIVGDVNGDGFDDFIVGARFGDDGGSGAGEAYVVFGGAGSFGADVAGRQVIDLTSLSSGQGFIIQGDVAGDDAGVGVSGAGDINGDGYIDLLVGARSGDDGGSGAGEAYVIFGGSGSFGVAVGGRQVIDLTSLSASEGFIIQGDTDGDDFGRRLSNAGDVNGDGIDDIIASASFGDDGGAFAGEAYVIFGSSSTFGVDLSGRQVIDTTSLSITEGFIIQGDYDGDNAGRSVSSAGDVNGDGFDDLIVGASSGDDGGGNAGEAYVIFGGSGTFGDNVSGRQVVDLSSLSPLQGFIIQGDETGDAAGATVSSVGDINGDGFDDIIIGAQNGDDGGSYAGEAYVLFGGDGTFGSDVSGRQVVDLTALAPSEGFIVQGTISFGFLSRSASAAGDVNGDGFSDFVIGAPFEYSQEGRSYVVFGSDNEFGETISGRNVLDLANFGADQGFVINGDTFSDDAGDSVSGAGDINGDGFDDLLVGASNGDDGGGDAGEAYVIFGGQFQVGDGTGETILGTPGAESLIGDVGDDSLTGNGGADVFRGGAGDDVITVSDLTFADIDGGTGADTLALSGGGQTLDLTTTLPAEIQSIETIDLTGSGDNTLVLNQLSVFDLTEERSGGDATITVQGNAGDTVDFSSEDGWAQNGTTVIDTVTYDVYENGNAVVNVQQGVGVSLAVSASVSAFSAFVQASDTSLPTTQKAGGFFFSSEPEPVIDLNGDFEIDPALDFEAFGEDTPNEGGYHDTGAPNDHSGSGANNEFELAADLLNVQQADDIQDG